MDRRTTPFSGRIAHVSLKGIVDAPLTEGEAAQIILPITDLLASPAGERDRQLLLGAVVTVIDRDQGHVYVQATRDGYCGWLSEKSVGRGPQPTHWVVAPGAHLYTEPQVRAPERACLSLGARLAIVGSWGDWGNTPHGFVPLCHVRPVDHFAPDPVSVAESLLGTPYLWGGNSRSGIDCSGLVQMAFHAAGRDCPGDADMQMVMGRGLSPTDKSKRGDLMFWEGHVAMVVNNELLVHANGHTMSVAYEGINDAISRISSAGGGLVQARQRF